MVVAVERGNRERDLQQRHRLHNFLILLCLWLMLVVGLFVGMLFFSRGMIHM